MSLNPRRFTSSMQRVVRCRSKCAASWTLPRHGCARRWRRLVQRLDPISAADDQQVWQRGSDSNPIGLHLCLISSAVHSTTPPDRARPPITAMRNLPVVPICRMHFRLSCRANHWSKLARLAPEKRGVSRSSRTLGAGCDGRFGRRKTSAAKRAAKSCGPDPPTLGSRWR